MLEIQKYLLTQGNSPTKLEEEFGIYTTVSDDQKLTIFNYDQIKSNQKFHPIVIESRGLVLETGTWKLVAKSFSRFFNYGEALEIQKQFNFNHFSTLEKVDGSLLLIYNYEGVWHLNTRASFGKGFINNSEHTWESLFLPFFKNLDKIPSSFTIVAEGCSIFNKVVQHFKEPKVVLLSVFDTNDNGRELDLDFTKKVADTINIEQPKLYSFRSVEQMKEYLDAVPDPTFEGFVLRDIYDNRLKVKGPKYLGLHRMVNNHNLFLPQNILPVVLAGEETEVILYYPEYRPFIEGVAQQVAEQKAKLSLTWEQNRVIVSQKEFALAIKDEPLKAVLFQARKYNDFHKAFLESGDLLLKVIK